MVQLTTTPWAESSSISVPPQHRHVLLCAAAMATTRVVLQLRTYAERQQDFAESSKMLRSKVATREGYMEENEDSSTSEGRTRKGVFTIPSVSEIKKASKVSVVTSAPTLFKTVAAHASSTTIVPPPTTTTTTTTTAEALHELNRPKSGQPLNVTDNELANMRDRDQNAGSIQSRKRPREDPEHSVEVPPKLAAGADNERVLPQLGSNLQGPAILPTIGGSTTMTSDSRKLFSGAASEGAASASTSTSLASVHHPHAIIASPVQV